MNSRSTIENKQFGKVLNLMIIVFLINILVFTYSSMPFITSSKAADDVKWDVELSITESDGTNDNVVFGEATDASNGRDDYDIPTPPTPQPPYLRAWFTTNLDPPYNMLWEDYRLHPNDHNAWNLSLRWIPENDSSTNVTISWDISQVADTGYSSALLISDAEIEVDMMTDNHYTFTAPPMTSHNFQIIFHSETSNGVSDTNEIPYLLPIFIIIILVAICVFALFWKKTKR